MFCDAELQARVRDIREFGDNAISHEGRYIYSFSFFQTFFRCGYSISASQDEEGPLFIR